MKTGTFTTRPSFRTIDRQIVDVEEPSPELRAKIAAGLKASIDASFADAFGISTSQLPPEDPPTATSLRDQIVEEMRKLIKPGAKVDDISIDPFTNTMVATWSPYQIVVLDAQRQCRTPRDVLGPWVRPGRVPSKAAGRRGTRRAWKRKNPPHRVYLYREPEDIIHIVSTNTFIMTPAQEAAFKKGIDDANQS